MDFKMILFQPHKTVAFGLAIPYEDKNDIIQLVVYEYGDFENHSASYEEEDGEWEYGETGSWGSIEYGIIYDLIDHIFTEGLR
jgi:hypothetical protein